VPTYDYQCRTCGRITEVVHSMTEDGPSTCEHCGGPLRRVLYPTGIIFKGSGFYVTDSRSTGNGGRRSSPGTSRTTTEGTAGEGPTSDGKPKAGPASDAGASKPEAKP